MAELVFLDTSFVIALEDSDDQYHQQAHGFWQGFVQHPKNLITHLTQRFMIYQKQKKINHREHRGAQRKRLDRITG